MIVTAIIITLLALLGIILLCHAAIWLEKQFPGKKFDEMQMLSRLKSYRLAFIIGFLYYLATVPILTSQVDGEKIIEPYLLVTVGFLLQMMVIHTYSLLNHAALPLGENPLVSIGGYAFMGFLWMTSFRNEYERYQDILQSDANSILQLDALGLTGQSTIIWFYLAYSICFFYLALTHIIQFLRSWKE